jgi:hypothetical protein
MREHAGPRRESSRAARGPRRDKVRAPNDLRLHRDHAARFCFWRHVDDRLSDIPRAHRPRCHRRIGGVLVNTEIIQFIPRPNRDDVQTDFPTIAFRATLRESSIGHVDASSDKHGGPASREA